MPIKLEFGGIELTGDLQPQPSGAARAGSGAVRIGLIGDFRGRGSHGPIESGSTLAGRRGHRVDRDDLDAVLSRLGVALSLTLPADPARPIRLAFRELDDFHPDRLLARADVFAALRATRDRLDDPATFADAAVELGVPPRAAEPPQPSPAAQAPPENLLDLILQQSSTSRPAPSARSSTWGAFLEQITAPHIYRENPRQAELVAGVDAAMAQLLRDILHHPDFQALESLWRAVHLLTRRLETGPDFTLELIDLTRAELEADLLSTTPLESTAAIKLLVEPSVGTEGSQPWTLLVGDFSFGPSRRDTALLWRLGQVARLAGAPFLAAASPRFVGCDSLAATLDPDDWAPSPDDEGWSDLRRSGEAAYLGLALPRFLLRAPYGTESSPIETFAFEEFPGPPNHSAYLWGNPAFAVAFLVGASFDARGHFDPRRFSPDLTDLPLALERTDDGETRAKPCAEVLLGTRAADRLLDTGLMPFQSIRDRDAIRLARLISIADPALPLAVH
jgi:type VI secretion system protein ImpC